MFKIQNQNINKQQKTTKTLMVSKLITVQLHFVDYNKFSLKNTQQYVYTCTCAILNMPSTLV